MKIFILAIDSFLDYASYRKKNSKSITTKSQFCKSPPPPWSPTPKQINIHDQHSTSPSCFNGLALKVVWYSVLKRLNHEDFATK